MTRTLTTSVVPANYSELFEHYYPYVIKLVRSFNIAEDDVEDVAMIILTKFLEKDSLSHYDAEHITKAGKPTEFLTFLSGFVSAYIKHYVHRQYVLRRRHPVSVDTEVSSHGGGQPAVPWMEVYGPKHYDDHREVEDEQFLARTRAQLATVPVVGKRDLSLLFEMIVLQLEETGRMNMEELSNLFDVSWGSINNWVKALRNYVERETT